MSVQTHTVTKNDSEEVVVALVGEDGKALVKTVRLKHSRRTRIDGAIARRANDM